MAKKSTKKLTKTKRSSKKEYPLPVYRCLDSIETDITGFVFTNDPFFFFCVT